MRPLPAPVAGALLLALFVNAPASGTIGPLWTEHGASSSWDWAPAIVGPVGVLGFHTNPRGNYNANECSMIDSPVLDRQAVGDDLAVRFEQWYRIEESFGWAYDGGLVLLRVDDGPWTPLPVNDHVKTPRGPLLPCLAENGLPPTTKLLSGRQMTWQSEVVPIPEHSDASTFQLRFLFLSDSTIRFEGWSLRNVAVGDARLLL